MYLNFQKKKSSKSIFFRIIPKQPKPKLKAVTGGQAEVLMCRVRFQGIHLLRGTRKIINKIYFI